MIIFTSSCTKDELARTTVSTGEKAEPVKIEQVVGCSIYSPPPLDILILYDNSTSLYYFKRNIKAAIRELGTRLTNFEDFRICIAPLIYQGEPNREFKCQSYVQTNPQQNSASVNPVGLNDVSIDGITTNVYAEKSFERVVTMLKKNKYTAAEIDPIFRPEAVTVAIVVSNGDDTDVCRDSWGHANECGKINYWSSKLLDFKNELALKQIRFISVVNKSKKPACGGTARYPGIRYSLFSRVVYEAQGLTSDNRPTKDSYDLCGTIS